jgi:hypothetical protein
MDGVSPRKARSSVPNRSPTIGLRTEWCRAIADLRPDSWQLFRRPLRPSTTVSIPVESFHQLNAELRSTEWPNNSVAIGGLEPISFTAFSEVLAQSDNPAGTKNVIAGTSTFANLCCIWIKNNEGNVKTFIQPKQTRSKAEQATQGMYEGDFVLLFHADLLSFALPWFASIVLE